MRSVAAQQHSITDRFKDTQATWERIIQIFGALLGDCLEELVGESSKLPGDFDPVPGGILRR